MAAFDEVVHGACATSNARRLSGHRDLQCLWIDARPEMESLPGDERQQTFRIEFGWRFVRAERLDVIRSIGQKRRTDTANKRIVLLRLELRRLRFDVRESENLMSETKSPRLTKM
jgi:hypothetical protein